MFKNKKYFTIFDFTGASKKFFEPDWDGEPDDIIDVDDASSERDTAQNLDNNTVHEVLDDAAPDAAPLENTNSSFQPPLEKLQIQLGHKTLREFHCSVTTLFYQNGQVIDARTFIKTLYNTLPRLFENEAKLRELWSHPQTRSQLLERLSGEGFNHNELNKLRHMLNTPAVDLFDVLQYIAYAKPPCTRARRAELARSKMLGNQIEQTNVLPFLTPQQKEFINFVIDHYIKQGVDELAEDKLTSLVKLKYNTLDDAKEVLGDLNHVRKLFVGFQRHLYAA